jgi:Txe/YoeB family toxin of Txe-Axe toxin-antitoxin module
MIILLSNANLASFFQEKVEKMKKKVNDVMDTIDN